MHKKRENCFQLFVEHAAIKENNDNNVSLHRQENVDGETQRTPEFNGKLLIHKSYYIKHK